MADITENLATVRQRVQISINSDSINPDSINKSAPTLVAVSKTRSAAEIAALHDLGIHNFGENYVEEALAKIQSLQARDICWHYIGAIQSNKTAQLAAYFDWVQSVDRLKIARRLSEQRPAGLAPINICLQVNIGAEPQKAGLASHEVAALAAEVVSLPNLCLRGLMAIPRVGDEQQRCADFAAMCGLFTQLQQDYCEGKKGAKIDTLSMGMSADLELALQAGATMLRVGEALFGPRIQ